MVSEKIKVLYVDDEENFDLAYAITVHKSQGSDFKNVFLIVPQKQSLLSKELLYTALTRSKFRLFIFVQDTEENLLMKAKNNSHLIHRNTSLFKGPINKKGKYSITEYLPKFNELFCKYPFYPLFRELKLIFTFGCPNVLLTLLATTGLLAVLTGAVDVFL